MKIKLSIGTAVYNLDESLLREHIEGVIKQLNEETEFLLIDDCSANNAGEICREYAAENDRIRYIRMEKNGGLSRVRNRTIEEARGEWIFFADGDDLLSDHFVETAFAFFDADSDIIIHDRLKFVGAKGAESPCEIKTLIRLPQNAGRELSVSCLCLDPHTNGALGLSPRAFYHAAWGALYRKDFLTEHHVDFPAGQKKAQDAVFNTKAYYFAQTVSYLPYVMYYYRNNPQGITRRYSADLPEISSSLIRHLEDCMETFYPHDESVRERFLNHRIMAIVMDNLRLNLFHRDNPHPKKVRKSEFLAFVDKEPYQSAIRCFNAKESGRREWILCASLLKRKRFVALDAFVGNDAPFNWLCGAVKRVSKLFG